MGGGVGVIKRRAKHEPGSDRVHCWYEGGGGGGGGSK